jgi:hypothetical protein
VVFKGEESGVALEWSHTGSLALFGMKLSSSASS